MTGAERRVPPAAPARGAPALAPGPRVDAAIRQAAIEALARRAEALQGGARLQLDTRLAQWRQAAVDQAAPPAGPDTPPMTAAPGPLAELLARLAREAGSADLADGTTGTETRQPAELKAVRQHRATWSRLSVDQRLAQALAQVPPQAGPLNTPWLLHQALQVLRDTSPAYLHRLMTQVEALLALAPAPPPAPPVRNQGGRSARDRKPGGTTPP